MTTRKSTKQGDEIRKRLASGVKPSQIAKDLGVSISGVYYYTSDKAKNRSKDRAAIARRSNKEWAVQLKGGCCLRCGYSKCKAALVFHHKDPFTKDITITGPHSRKRLERELEKTVLLCSICHTELHSGMWTDAELKQHDLAYFPMRLQTGRGIFAPSKTRGIRYQEGWGTGSGNRR